MSENFEALLKQHEEGRVKSSPNSIVDGEIIEITKDHVMVDIGYKAEGMIPVSEFYKSETERVITNKVGDTIKVFLFREEDNYGNIIISKKEADRLSIWEEMKAAYENETIVHGKIVSRVKGGLQVDIGIKAFLPGSQIDLRPIRHLEKLIGEEYDFKVIKVNQKRGNIVLSRRALLEKERESLKSDTLDNLSEGLIVNGIIKNLTDYGAFVDLGGIDGLLHITDMSWGRVNHPSELFHVGDELKVKVLSFDKEHERVSLGLKQISDDPWVIAEDRYDINSRHKGKIVSLADYGAFVQLENGVEGLIHISEMSWTKRIKHPSRLLAVGDEVEVMVLSLDRENKRIALGMKQMEENPWVLLSEKYPMGSIIKGKVKNLTDFGVFIGIEEGIDGLIHVSDISWTQKIRHPKEMFKKGDEIDAKVLNIDIENERFSLGIKQISDDPWAAIPNKYETNKNIEATIIRKVEFGYLVELEPELVSYLHRSEVPSGDSYNVGDKVMLRVTHIEAEDRKVSVSVKAYREAEERGFLEDQMNNEPETVKMSDFMKNLD